MTRNHFSKAILTPLEFIKRQQMQQPTKLASEILNQSKLHIKKIIGLNSNKTNFKKVFLKRIL